MKMYFLGLATGHGSFPPASANERKRLARLIKTADDIALPSSYDTFCALKESMLLGRPRFQPVLQHATAAIRRTRLLKKPSVRPAKTLQRQLVAFFQTHGHHVDAFFRQKNLPTADCTVIIIPGIGERGESLGRTVVLGDRMHRHAALAIVLEEILHGVLRRWGKARRLRKLLPTNDPFLAEEAIVGAVLYRLLEHLRIQSRTAQSVVFGWHGGKRERLVRLLLKQGAV